MPVSFLGFEQTSIRWVTDSRTFLHKETITKGSITRENQSTYSSLLSKKERKEKGWLFFDAEVQGTKKKSLLFRSLL